MAGLVPFNRGAARLPMAGNFYNMLDDFFNDSWFPVRSLMSDTFKVDVRNEDTQYVIEADLPGVKKDEVTLSMKEGCLTLGVNSQEEVSDDRNNYIHRERRFSSMQRSIYLADADEANVSAKLEDGVLKVSVPKLEKTPNSHRIEIQ